MNNREIVVEELVKKHSAQVTAIDGLSFQVKGGSIFGFLSPNGAGKSTTIKIPTTLALPTEGSAIVGSYEAVNDTDQAHRMLDLTLRVCTRRM